MKFKDNVGIIPELDLVEDDDKITHEISLDDEDLGKKVNTQDECNIFQYDANYKKNEDEWEQIKKEILGEHATQMLLDQQNHNESEEEEAPEIDENVSISTTLFNLSSI